MNSDQTGETVHSVKRLSIFNLFFVCLVSPAEYQSNFQIDSSSGVLSVQTPIDREEMSSSVITVNIKVTTILVNNILVFEQKCETTDVMLIAQIGRGSYICRKS